jgi:hypothetical protein
MTPAIAISTPKLMPGMVAKDGHTHQGYSNVMPIGNANAVDNPTVLTNPEDSLTNKRGFSFDILIPRKIYFYPFLYMLFYNVVLA